MEELEMNLNNNNQFNQDNNFEKKEKLKWWIPVVLFFCGLLMFIINIVVSIIVESQEDLVLESTLLKNPIIMSFRWLAFIFWLMVIPSLIIVIAKYKRKRPYEEIQNDYQIDNMINNAKSLDEKLLIAYIGNNYQQIMQQKFSFSALFLSWIYTLYRKVYIPSIIGMIAFVILGFLPNLIFSIIALIFVIVLGINFNKWYIAYAKKQISKIKTNNPVANENELVNICKNKGGTNIWMAIVILVVFVIVNIILNPLNYSNGNLENYKGTWYTDENNVDVSIGNDILNIKTIENNIIIFDYTLSGLCGEKNISANISNNTATFKTLESNGTIEFKNNTIIFKVKNINYNETFERTFKK